MAPHSDRLRSRIHALGLVLVLLGMIAAAIVSFTGPGTLVTRIVIVITLALAPV